MTLARLNHVRTGRGGANLSRVSAARRAHDEPLLTDVDSGEDLAERTLSKPIPDRDCVVIIASNTAVAHDIVRSCDEHHWQVRALLLKSCLSSNLGTGLTPNAPMNGAGVRSTEASVPLAG